MPRRTISEREKLIAVPGAKDGACVYLIAGNEFVKIGLANDLQRRFWNMQVNCPYELKILKWWITEDAASAEDCMQSNLEKYRVRGEWFALPAKELEWLVSMPDLSLFTW
jgi:hypothetical protein